MFLKVAAAQSTPWPIQLHRRWQRTMLMSDAPSLAYVRRTPWPIQLDQALAAPMRQALPAHVTSNNTPRTCSQAHRRCRRRLSFVSKRLCNNTPRDQALPDVAITQQLANTQSFSIKADSVPI